MEQTVKSPKTHLEKFSSIMDSMNYNYNNPNNELNSKLILQVDTALCMLFNEQKHTNDEIINMRLWADLSKENCLDLLITDTLEKEHSMMK